MGHLSIRKKENGSRPAFRTGRHFPMELSSNNSRTPRKKTRHILFWLKEKLKKRARSNVQRGLRKKMGKKKRTQKKHSFCLMRKLTFKV
jgi:hypothetical protein